MRIHELGFLKAHPWRSSATRSGKPSCRSTSTMRFAKRTKLVFAFSGRSWFAVWPSFSLLSLSPRSSVWRLFFLELAPSAPSAAIPGFSCSPSVLPKEAIPIIFPVLFILRIKKLPIITGWLCSYPPCCFSWSPLSISYQVRKFCVIYLFIFTFFIYLCLIAEKV